jgi:hypothetical protein
VSKPETPPDLEAHMALARDLNEKILDYAKHTDSVYLETYERTLQAMTEFQAAAAEASDDARVRALGKAYAKLNRDVNEAYVTAARELRK